MASAASGATPPFSHRFSGKGRNLWNQNSSWVKHGTGTYSFRISRRSYSSTPYVHNFRGTYTTACSSHTLRLFVGAAPVRKGKFSFRFHDHGAWVKVWGSFSGSHGQKATVNYLANFSKTKSYNQKSPGSLGCAAWVRGTAR
jgi:hypothetical protein